MAVDHLFAKESTRESSREKACARAMRHGGRFQKGPANPQSGRAKGRGGKTAHEGSEALPAVGAAHARGSDDVGEPPPGGSRAAGKRTRGDVGVRCAAHNCDRVVADADGTPMPGERVVRLLLVSLCFV